MKMGCRDRLYWAVLEALRKCSAWRGSAILEDGAGELYVVPLSDVRPYVAAYDADVVWRLESLDDVTDYQPRGWQDYCALARAVADNIRAYGW